MVIVICNEPIISIIIVFVSCIAHYVRTKGNACSERSRQILFIASYASLMKSPPCQFGSRPAAVPRWPFSFDVGGDVRCARRPAVLRRSGWARAWSSCSRDFDQQRRRRSGGPRRPAQAEYAAAVKRSQRPCGLLYAVVVGLDEQKAIGVFFRWAEGVSRLPRSTLALAGLSSGLNGCPCVRCSGPRAGT